MNYIRTLGLVSAVALIVGTTATNSHALKSLDLQKGKKCECFDGAANCFFDGTRCPVSKGKCKCVTTPKSQSEEHQDCCISGDRNEANGQAAAAAKFCLATCPVKVGGVTCGAECKRLKGRSGKHMCIKLHDF